MRRSFSRRAQPRRWALAAARCTARLAWCACALRGGQGAWRAARGASSGLGPPFEGSLARWGVVARWGCSSRACRSLVLDLACWCLQNSDPELSAIYCGSWQFGRVSQSFLGFRRLQFLRLQLQVLRLRLRLQVSRLRLRVWRRDVPPGSCCASVSPGPDGGQRQRQQRPRDDRGGGGCPRRSAGSRCGCSAIWGTRLGYSRGCSLIAGCSTGVPQQRWPPKSTSAGVCVWSWWWGRTGWRTGQPRWPGWRQSFPWAWAATRREL